MSTKNQNPYLCMLRFPLTGTLAHAYMPQYYVKGNVHMDNAEKWSANMQPGSINTFITLVHELGHALGLPHANSGDEIMAPFYDGRIREADVEAGPWEKAEMRAAYGTKECTGA